MSNIPFEPLLVAHLFPVMRAELLQILNDLSDTEWSAPTACTGWTVKDVALHLLGDGIGLLSNLRDGEGHFRHFETFQALVDYINTQNDLWIQATRRMSRRVLLTQLESVGHEVSELMASLDPYEMVGSIGWTGNPSDPMWLHIAREYTEYWMHHQHICEAVNRIRLKTARYMHPLLRTFAYAFPQTYREVDVPQGTTIQITITGDGGGNWFVIRESDAWQLYAHTDNQPEAIVTMDVDSAWRMFTKGIDRQVLFERASISGDTSLGAIVLDTVAIIA